MSAVQQDAKSKSGLADGGAFLVEENGSRPIFAVEDFTDEQRMFFKTADDFARNEIGSRAQEIDDHGLDLMPGLLRKAAELGLCMVEIPEAYGGLGRDITTSMVVTEAMSSVGSWTTTWGAHTGIGCLPIVFFGTEEQKKKYLPRLATAEIIGAYALSEAGSGSDALGAKTKAVLSKDGKHYVLNGGKMWITNSRWAGTFIVFAKVDGEKFTAFVVERDTPGFTVGKEEHKMGLHGSSTCPLMFEDAMVPVENVLGEVGKGHRIAFNILNHGRLKLGIGTLGGCRHMIDIAVRYARDRKQFATPIIEFGLIRRKLAEMASRTYALQCMGYRTAGLIDSRIAQGPPVADAGHNKHAIDSIEEHNVEASIMKVFGSETLHFTIDETLQIHGGYGFTEEYPVAKPYRDSRVNRIFEGTNEINRMLIPGTLLKRALKGKFPLMDLIGKTEAEIAKGSLPKFDGLLAPERRATEMAKRAFALCVGAAAMKWQAELEKQQEVLSDLADIAIDVFGMDSCVTRARQAAEKLGEAKAGFHVDMTRLFVLQAAERVAQNARHIAAAATEGADREALLGKLARLDGSDPAANLPKLREKVAAQVVELGGFVLPEA